MEQVTLKGQLANVDIHIDPNQEMLLQMYLGLLARWNQAYSLTAITHPDAMRLYHVVDSLLIAKYISSGQTILDVGTGPGLPGVPLAIYYPDKRFYLLDSNGKKTRFLKHICISLRLKNVSIIESRVEQYESDCDFDYIVTRAFSDLPKMLNLCEHLASSNTTFLAMKGQLPSAEMDVLPQDQYNIEVHQDTLPSEAAENRHCIAIRPRKVETTE